MWSFRTGVLDFQAYKALWHRGTGRSLHHCLRSARPLLCAHSTYNTHLLATVGIGLAGESQVGPWGGCGHGRALPWNAAAMDSPASRPPRGLVYWILPHLLNTDYSKKDNFRITGECESKKNADSVFYGVVVTVEKPLPSPICHPLVRGMILGDLSRVISLLQASWLCAEVIDLVGDRCSRSQPASLLRGALKGIVELC